MKEVVIAAVCAAILLLGGCSPFCEMVGFQCSEVSQREFYDRYIDQETKLRNERLEREGRLTAYRPPEPTGGPTADPDWRPWERQNQRK